MRFRLLGPLEVIGAAGPMPITAERQRIVLSALLLEANRIVPTDRLVDAVWGDVPPPTGRGQIQICVSMLRNSMAKVGVSDAIRTSSPGYVANVADDDLDLKVFERLAAAGRAAAEGGRYDEAASAFGDALALWRGQSHIDSGSTALHALVARLNEQRLAVVEQWVDARLALGLHQQLVEELIALVLQNPLREHFRAQLMLALYRSGRQAEALEAYRCGRRHLIDELGIEPGEELRSLEQSILAGEVEGSAPAVAAPIATPVAAAPVAATAVAPPPAPRTVAPEAKADAEPERHGTELPGAPRLLPGAIADFTGRDDLMARLRDVIESPPEASYGLRIASITGKTGVGKTTLAVQLGQSMADRFPDGQLFAKLRWPSAEPVPPTQILERFLRSLGVPGAAMPATLEERAELFRHHVADRRLLILLDDAVDEEQVRWLLPGTASCPVLVTSRSGLTGLEGAQSVRVDPLADDQALRLLGRIAGEQRIEAELPSAYELIELCGGLALALRIVGGRLAARPHWTLSQLAARLHDEEQRLDELAHGGLGVRASLAVSYECLPPDARRLFHRLSALEVGEFAGWVAAPLLDMEAAEAEDALEALVDARLVDVARVRGRTRYRLADLVRCFSRERLREQETAAERSAVLGRVLAGWLSLLEEVHRRAFGADHPMVSDPGPSLAFDWSVPDHELADPLEWYETEREALTATMRQGAGAGFGELCRRIALMAVAIPLTRSSRPAGRLSARAGGADVLLWRASAVPKQAGRRATLAPAGARAVPRSR